MVNNMLLVFFVVIFVRAMDLVDLGFLFLTRAMGILWFDYDWYKAFHEWYERVDARLKEKERMREEKKKIAEENMKQTLIIEGDTDETTDI